MNQAVKDFLIKNVAPEDLLWNEPMERHITFRVGGEADVLVQVRDDEMLQKLVSYLAKINQEYFVLGKGSNLLVSDQGYRGIILDMSKYCTEARVEGNKVFAKAGASLPQVAILAAVILLLLREEIRSQWKDISRICPFQISLPLL